MAHARAVMRDTHVRLLGPLEVRLRDEDVTHGQHTQAAQLLRRVEHHGRETTRHFGVESDLDTRLNLVLAFDEEVEEFLRVDDGFTEVGHQTDQRRVPFINDLHTNCTNDSIK